ncbi:hypothetical protein FG379_003569 [Cryptosporidium bovis]|uniref:uncharacterized protein n=1 Tax=Cryptosporidium bovis TaxID=310047 RepID=UPI00351A345C|nr:hypothetical protein FG379_003569 [Cryptosporidium bovis]
MSESVNYRDLHGRLIDKESWYKDRIYRNKKKKGSVESKIDDEEFLKYRGGIVQYNQSIDRQNEYNLVSDLVDGGNYYMNRKYDEELKKKVHWDDPINTINSEFNTKEKLAINYNLNRLKCKYITPQNRFSIESGYRWDGVIRGNGFEEKYLLKQSENDSKRFDY